VVVVQNYQLTRHACMDGGCTMGGGVCILWDAWVVVGGCMDDGGYFD